MVLSIDSCSNAPIHWGSFQSPVQSDRIVPMWSDTIRFGTEKETLFSQVTTKVKSFFQWIYLKVRFVLSKIFFCFKWEETTVERCKRNIDELDSLGRLFEKQCEGKRAALKSWWEKAFNSLDFDVRKMLILEDVKTYAPEDSDEEAWANENYLEYRDLATKFVKELEVVKIRGTLFDPIDNIHDYIENVKCKLEAKIQE